MDSTSNIVNQISFRQMLTWFLSKKSLCLDDEGSWVVAMIAKSISLSYKTLTKAEVTLKTLDIEIDIVNEKDYLSQDADYLKPILQLRDFVNLHIKEYVVDFLVHGSMSTLDYSIGWSDLDTLVVVKSETIENSKKLIDFRKEILYAQDFLYKIDPLQHHGFIYCSEFDLSQYLSHCMPVEVLQESKSLIRKSKLSIKHNRSKLEARYFFDQKVALFKQAYEEGVLAHHKINDRYLQENYADINTMYQMKYFLSVLMSLPALYLDALGMPCYKKDSFDIVRKNFGNEWEIIEKASAIRSKWHNCEPHSYVGNRIPEWLQKDLGDLYFDRAYLISKIMSEKLGNIER
jgi:hypothetical protein